jgi:hypothetical protein
MISMLQAHSFLWHYFWAAPNVLLLALACLLWRRGLGKKFPAFVAYAAVSAIGQLAIYAADLIPSVSPANFWRVDWASLLVEGPLKFVVVGEIFANVLEDYSSLARVGRFLISCAGVVLVLVAALAAAYTPPDGMFGIVSGAHLLEQTIYLILSGLLVFIFLFSSYFRLSFSHRVFGIALGLGVSACVHLSTWAVMASGRLPDKRDLLDFLNMATYHVCVLIWFYYLLVPQTVAAKPTSSLPDHNLDVWNRELERLLKR